MRNIHRDLAILELAGVPFFYDPDFGVGGGYRIQPGWFFPTPSLTPQELIDIAVVARGAEGGAIPFVECVSEVRDKLLTTARPEDQDTLRQVDELFDVFTIGTPQAGECRNVMHCFQQALLTRRQIEGVYDSPTKDGDKRLRLQPRRIFLTAGTWYTACTDPNGKTKLYRLARFKDVNVTAKPMTVSKEFSLREFLGNAWCIHRGSRDWHVEILFNKESAPYISEATWHRTQELVPQKDGSLIFRATVAGFEEIKYWILSWGPKAKVTKPKELAAELRKLAQETAQTYGT